MKRRLLVILIACVFIAFGLLAPFEQTITGRALIEPAHSWSLRHFGSGLIATEWDRNLTGREAENRYFQLETPDITDIELAQFLREGVMVDSGDTVASLHSRENERRLADYELSLFREQRRRNALASGARVEDLQVAQRRVEEARIRYETDRLEYERVQSLYNQDLMPLAELQEAEGEFLQSQAEFHVAEAIVEASEAGAHPAEIDVQDAEISRMERLVSSTREIVTAEDAIVSPLAGVVRRQTDVRSLLSIDGIDTLSIRVVIPEAFAYSLNPGSQIELWLPGMTERCINFEIDQVGFFGNDTIAVYGLGLVGNPDGVLQPGMHGTAKIPVGTMTLFERIRHIVFTNQ